MTPRTLGLALASAVLAALLALVPSAALAGPGDAPTAPMKYFSTAHGTPFSGNLCTGATDPQGGPITVAAVYSTEVVHNAQTCAFTYTPAAGASGPAHGFSYRLTDGVNVSDPLLATVSIGVAGNAPPVAQPDTIAAGRNRWVLIEDIDAFLLANDTDPEGHPLTQQGYSVGTFLPGEEMLGAPAFGPRAIAYRPPTDFVGTRRWEYHVGDGTNQTRQEWSVTVTDKGAFQKPVAQPDTYEVARNGSLTVSRAQGVLANDSDADSAWFTANGSMSPAHGKITGLNRSTGVFTYTPDAGFLGTDTMKYYPVDPEGNSGDLVTVTFKVSTPPPVAVGDSYKTAMNTPLVVDAAHGLLDNDTDADSSFVISSVIAGLHGTPSVNHNTGAFTYTPHAGWVGTDTFGYRLIDTDNNYSAWANVTVKTVAPGVNEAPDVQADSYEVHQNGTLTIGAGSGPLANDSDFEKTDLDIATRSVPAHGSFTSFDDETGAFTYVPTPGWHGTETVTYKAVDAAGAQSAQGTIEIEVVNDRPVAVGDSYTTVPGVPFEVPAAEGVLVNDSDPEGEPIESASWALPQHGTLKHHTDGSFTYTPEAGFTGVETLWYSVRDELYQESEPATLTITVQPGTISSPTPTLGGTARVGRVLTAGTSTWGPGAVTKSYRWLRNGAPITGATGASYRLVAADLGRKVSVRVTGTKAGYPTVVRTSGTRTVARGLLTTARPRIAGTPVTGRLLTAYAGTWGPGAVTKTFRWYRNGVAIKGTTGASYRLTKADRGRRITVRVTGRKTAYVTAVRTSASVLVR